MESSTGNSSGCPFRDVLFLGTDGVQHDPQIIDSIPIGNYVILPPLKFRGNETGPEVVFANDIACVSIQRQFRKTIHPDPAHPPLHRKYRVQPLVFGIPKGNPRLPVTTEGMDHW